MPSKLIRLLLFMAVLFALAGCAKHYKPNELASGIAVGGTYYTRFSLFQEKNLYRTTNYRRGFLIPINTPVTLVSIDKKRVVLSLAETEQPLTIENVPKHTHEDSQQAFLKIFGKRKVDLSKFGPEERNAILQGQVRKGMSRKAVLAAIGYPPPIGTPDLRADDWTYWASRFDRFIVRFKDDRVVDIAH